jgi:hypothetical protein
MKGTIIFHGIGLIGVIGFINRIHFFAALVGRQPNKNHMLK